MILFKEQFAMKKHTFIAGLLLHATLSISQVSINTDAMPPASSAMLDVSSTSRGILIPRMTASQRDAITAPVTGLLVYVSDENTFYFRSGSSWIPLLSSITGDGQWITSGSNLYSGVTGNIGIGLTNPGQQLELSKSFKLPVTSNSTTGIIFKGDNAFIHDFKPVSKDGYNVFIGSGSGNFTLGGGSFAYEASSNIGIGVNTLHALFAGYENIAIGTNSMAGTFSGMQNIAIGSSALANNNNGGKNVSIGVQSTYHSTL
jgi:hypothetical protein